MALLTIAPESPTGVRRQAASVAAVTRQGTVWLHQRCQIFGAAQPTSKCGDVLERNTRFVMVLASWSIKVQNVPSNGWWLLYDAFFDQFREVFLLLPSFGVRNCLPAQGGDGLGGMGCRGDRPTDMSWIAVASGIAVDVYNKPAPKTYARVAMPANERGLVNSHELLYLAFQYIPYISLQTLDWCTSFNSFHMMKGLTSRLPKPLTKTTKTSASVTPCPSVGTTRCLELDTKQLAFFQVITAPRWRWGAKLMTNDGEALPNINIFGTGHCREIYLSIWCNFQLKWSKVMKIAQGSVNDRECIESKHIM